METDFEGLSSSEAKKLLQEHGLNELPETPPPGPLEIFLEQLKSPLVYVLLGAGLVTILIGDYEDAAIIFAAVLINTILGFIQEERAGAALQALREMIHPTSVVIRDGEEHEIPGEEIVPGDIVVLNQGHKVPADGVFIKTNRMFVAEAILTGESVPVPKEPDDRGFMGTVVTAGRGYLKVEGTGADTEMGKIALRVQEVNEETPLRRQLGTFSRQLTYLTIFLVVFVFVVGLSTGKDLFEVFITSVALAVSSIPEGLLVALTVVLAIGTQRILKRRGLVRNLVSAETLGGVTTICADKTGTLTEGKMKVVNVAGDRAGLVEQAIVANDHDDPIVLAMDEWARGEHENYKKLLEERVRHDSIPFSAKERFFASINKLTGKKNVIYVNGAPEKLLEWSNISSTKKEEFRAAIGQLTNDGKRLIGMAKKEVSSKKRHLNARDVKKGLSFVGVIAYSDPPRVGVEEALAKTREAHVRTIVITGDYAQTAQVVMRSLGIEVGDDQTVLGEELSQMSDGDLAGRLDSRDTLLFARTTPEQKLKIVEALKKNGEVVAMTGDGVNDAPALSKADIGVVVGEATDVAKESADLVLLDSSFATIVAAIEEGRGIFDNIRKIILYLMSDAFEEILAVVAAIIFRLPLPVGASQILWINLISDGFPNLALTVDPKSPDIMKHPPRDPKELLVAPWMRRLIMIVSAIGGVMAFLIFVYAYRRTGDIGFSRSVAFGTLGVNSLVYVFSVRTLTEPFWVESPLDNNWLTLAVGAGLLLQFLPFFVRPVGEFIDVEPIGIFYWGLIFGASFVMFLTIEISKHIFKENLKRHHTKWS